MISFKNISKSTLLINWRLAASIFGVLIAATPTRTLADSCIPPVFYQSVPRDSDWYYGVGKDIDTDRARDIALINLGKQVTGSLQGIDSASMSQIVEMGVDRTRASETIGNLLPSSSLLAGWEQDDHSRCAGISYVLVRIEKIRVTRFLKEDQKFRDAVVRGVNSRVDNLKEGVAALINRLDALEQQNKSALAQIQALKNNSARGPAEIERRSKINNFQKLSKAIQIVRVQIRAKDGVNGQTLVALESLEKEFNDIRKSVEDSRKIHSESDRKAIEKVRAGIEDGSLRLQDFSRVQQIFVLPCITDHNCQELHELRLSATTMKRGYWGYLNRDFNNIRESALVLATGDAIQAKDWDLVIRLTQDYMNSYPAGGAFAGMEKFMNDAMQSKREAATASRGG